MTDLYLRKIGLINLTIVERINAAGDIERLESRRLDIASLVAFWKRCFNLNDLLFERITLHCKSKDFNAMSNKASTAGCRSVIELFKEQGVECIVDDEWFKGKEENDYKQKLIATEERYDALTKTSVEALEKRSKRLDELAEEFVELERKYDSLKSDFELAQALYDEKCEEFNKLCSDYTKLQAKNERFEQNIKSVLEIEKKNAVEEFAKKLKNLIFEQGNPYNVPYEEFMKANIMCGVIDDLSKENENE